MSYLVLLVVAKTLLSTSFICSLTVKLSALPRPDPAQHPGKEHSPFCTWTLEFRVMPLSSIG